MFLAGINFSLFYYAFTKKWDEVKNNSELKGYIFVTIFSAGILVLLESKTFGGFFKAVRPAVFQAISIMTTTGFSTSDYTHWSFSGQTIILLLLMIGGCSGSTAGGVKVVRWIILFKQLKNEIMRLLHPHGIFAIRLNGRAGRKDIVFTVAAFFMLYLIFVLGSTFFSTLFGLDLFTSFTASISMAGNVGPAFGSLGPAENFSAVPTAVKWCYSFVMTAGRLEFFTIAIIFAPAFWKK